MSLRGIIHVDMDAFYASVEQRDDPALRGRPLAVGGRDGRGVVAAASYEARAFGVRSAMPAGEALRRCPDLLFVRPRFDAYKEVSRQIRAIFRRFTPLVEPVSLDEAYLDVTRPLTGPAPPAEVAARIKAAILSETQLTASAGVSFNKFLAKTASGMNKPDGLTLVGPDDAAALLAGLAIEDFHGVGPRTAEKLRAVGILTGADLAQASEAWLVRRFGRSGAWLARIAVGQDDRPVEPDRPRRSVSVEQTFARDVAGRAALAEILRELVIDLNRRLEETGFRGRSVILKIRSADFVTRTRTTTPKPFPQDVESLWKIALGLLDRPEPPRGRVRLLGLGVNDGTEEADPRQFDLFGTNGRDFPQG
ncbi:DNA polymerase IV [Geminicoccus roseus]|uniref:DNA polymerase IV n=1 Tax=Geminicoccus roseus TaxID=404900 RepID=UPI0004047956|nr:DNA polymerase IV [Geminicoccus roseus]